MFFKLQYLILAPLYGSFTRALIKSQLWRNYTIIQKEKSVKMGFFFTCTHIFTRKVGQAKGPEDFCRCSFFRFSGVGLKSEMCLGLGGLPPILIFLCSFQLLACHDIFLILSCSGFTAVAGVCASRVAGFLNINRNYPCERERGRRGREKRK